MPAVPTKKLTLLTRCLIAGWGIVVLSGIWVVTAYSNSPGPLQNTPRHWPADTAISLDVRVPTIVLFVHPKCPCSMATLRELGRNLGDIADQIAVRIVVYCPKEASDSWTDTKLKELAEQLFPDSTLIDRNAIEARRFAAATSGHVFAFSPAGLCLFQGGVTSSRGHEGDNLGVQAIRQIAESKNNICKTTPVFGCPIVAFTSECSKCEQALR